MKPNNDHRRIKQKVQDSVNEYIAHQQIWENEGGAAINVQGDTFDHQIRSPLEPGKTFKMIHSHLEDEDDRPLLRH